METILANMPPFHQMLFPFWDSVCLPSLLPPKQNRTNQPGSNTLLNSFNRVALIFPERERTVCTMYVPQPHFQVGVLIKILSRKRCVVLYFHRKQKNKKQSLNIISDRHCFSITRNWCYDMFRQNQTSLFSLFSVAHGLTTEWHL